MSKLKGELFGKLKGQSAWDEVKEKLLGGNRPSHREPRTPDRQTLEEEMDLQESFHKISTSIERMRKLERSISDHRMMNTSVQHAEHVDASEVREDIRKIESSIERMRTIE